MGLERGQHHYSSAPIAKHPLHTWGESPTRGIALSLVEAVPAMASFVNRRSNSALCSHHKPSEVRPRRAQGLLTRSKHMGMLSLRINGSRSKRPPYRLLQDRPGAQGLYPSGTLTRTIRPRNLAKPKHAKASAQGSGARPSLRLPIYDTPKPNPWLLPGLRRQPRPGH
jgi:hypothetical protein